MPRGTGQVALLPTKRKFTVVSRKEGKIQSEDHNLSADSPVAGNASALLLEETLIRLGSDTQVVVLLDHSGSTGGLRQNQEDALKTIHGALSNIKNPNLDIFAYTSSQDNSAAEMTRITANDEGELDLELLHNSPMGGTPTADALVFAGDILNKKGDQKKAVILITDGVSDSPENTQTQLNAFKAARVPVAVLGQGVNTENSNDFTTKMLNEEYGEDGWTVLPRDKQGIESSFANAINSSLYEVGIIDEKDEQIL